MKRHIYNRADLPCCGDVECTQEDNIERDGYVNIEEQYNNFARAGINQMEYLKKMYPAGGATNEQIIKEGEAIEKGINIRHADEMDIADESRRINTKTEHNSKKMEQLKREREQLEKMNSDNQ